MNDPAAELLSREEGIRLCFQRRFGCHLRNARLEAGFMQSDVASITGLTQQYISLVEAGLQNMTLKTMILLAIAVGNDVLEMLGRGRG